MFLDRMKPASSAPTDRVWLSAFGRQTMCDVAKTVQDYKEEKQSVIFYKLIRGRGRGQLQRFIMSLRSRRRAMPPMNYFKGRCSYIVCKYKRSQSVSVKFKGLFS